ncbi:MAG: CPBP family intramembrane metalloprotease [Firmicutes bacterium]|nr:CPBP family intramembrane metalloprotease [Bacillota bacterium]
MPSGRKQKILLIVLTIIWVLITAVRVWNIASYPSRKPAAGEETAATERALYFNIVSNEYDASYKKIIPYINSTVQRLYEQQNSKSANPDDMVKNCIMDYAIAASGSQGGKDKSPFDDAKKKYSKKFAELEANPIIPSDAKEILGTLYFYPDESLPEGYNQAELEKTVNSAFDYSRIGWSDVADWNGLTGKLKLRQTEPDKRICEFLDPVALSIIDNNPTGGELDDKSKALILAGLNKILNNRDFYNLEVFKKTPLVPEGHDLYKKGVANLSESQLRRFNRLLLEGAHPSEFTQSKKAGSFFRDYSLYRLYKISGNADGKAVIMEKARLLAGKLTFGLVFICILLVAGLIGFFLLLILPLISLFKFQQYSLTGMNIGDRNNPQFSGILPGKAWLVFLFWEFMRFFAAINLGLIAANKAGIPAVMIFSIHIGVYALVLLAAQRIFSSKAAELQSVSVPASEKTEESGLPENAEIIQETDKPKAQGFSWAMIGIGNPKGINNFYGFLTGIGGYCCAIPLVYFGSFLYKYIVGTMPRSQNAALDIIGNISNLADGIMIFLMIGVIGPIFEEILFRGFLYTALRRYVPAYAGVLLVSFLFAAIHFDFNVFIGLFTLGAVLAILYERTGSLTPSIITHMIWNSMTFFLTITLIK